MSESLSNEQINTINQLDADARYAYFTEQVIAGATVWGLKNSGGWVILTSYDDEEFIPVWSSSALAAAWAQDAKADSMPAEISLQDWMNEWLPGMIKNGLLIAVSPNSEDDCITLGAEELLEDMKAAQNLP